MKFVGVLDHGKKLGPNGSYKQLLKYGGQWESRQGHGGKAQPCTGVRGAPRAAGLNELYCSLALIPATEDMMLRIQVLGWAGSIIFRVNGRDCSQS